ncbi:transcriptional regulator, AraC family [Tistlia consotensis]|uniref:Transcriptional regulator, AraC family n=1 Tax=Tistlia consotensis USBA 355 TaxID=560819 RepID=A0A1Y6BXP9_9PROT|nr:AraC family transcriptional regulator [Tistlia consotensis]SMF26487.1 transcriptional regulator, AraC family [Tistlia consotensis USBA 355]SNR67109.1 transcriptional regulator, AraC family [Tistlia consotensis]
MTIDQVLEALEVRIEPFALCQIRGESTLGLGRRPFAILHYVLSGSGRMIVGELPPIAARPGSVVLVPAFMPHWLHGDGTRGRPLPDCRPLDLSLEHLIEGNGEGVRGRTLTAICGELAVSYRGTGGALNLLKTPIAECLAPGDRVRNALDEFVYELAHPTVGTQALARSLMGQAVILLLRRRYLAGDPSLRWMEGATDESLWRALQAMLDGPGEPHSVERLASTASMSRSAFSKRFTQAYGTGPMELLRTIRLQRAAELLARSDLPVKRIADLVGYKSRTYFTRAFEAEYGVSPGQFKTSLLRK